MKHVFIALLWLFSTASSLNAAEPITIGVSLGLSGKHAAVSALQEKSFRLWERDVNNRGGLLGRKVQLIIHDDKSDPQAAQALYEQLIVAEKVDLLFAPYSSELTKAIAPITEKHNYPLIASGASADELWEKDYKYLFGLYSLASRYAAGFLALLVQHGFNNVAILHKEEAFSRNISSGTKQLAEKFGLNVLLYAGFEKGANNFDELAIKARDSHAQVLIMCGHFDESVAMRLALKKIGWQPKAYYASVGPALQAFHEKLGVDADYTFSSSQWERHGKLPGSEAYYKEFLKVYGEEPSYQAANAYAAGQILEMAVKKAGDLDRKKIRDLLSKMDTMSIIGRYGVDKAGRQIKHFPLIIEWQKGKKEIIWPEDLRTAKPLFH